MFILLLMRKYLFMKTKITLSIAGLLSGLVFGASFLTAAAAEPAAVQVNSVNGTVNQVDVATLQSSLSNLKVLLNQLSNDLSNGRITATNAATVNAALASAKENLIVLNATLAVLYPPSQNLAESEVPPAPKSEIQVGPSIETDQNNSAEAVTPENSNEQASLPSFLKSKTTIGVIIGIILLAAIALVLRRKPKTNAQMA